MEIKEIHVIDMGKVASHPDFEVSDGYHTFGELYEHRITLFITLCKCYWNLTQVSNPMVWRSKYHSDGQKCFGGDDWFVVGINKEPGQQITYHLPIEKWEECDFMETLDKAPDFDGHSPEDVINRLKDLI